MIWLVIALVLVIALIFKVSLLIILTLAAIALRTVVALVLLIDFIVLSWIALAVLVVFTVIDSEHRITLWFIGVGLLASFVILFDGNRSNLEPVQANPKTGALRPRRFAQQRVPAEFVAAPADVGMSWGAPASVAAAGIDQAVQQPAPVPPASGAEAPPPPPGRAVQQSQDNWPFVEDGASGSGLWGLARAAFAFRPRRRG